jgi:hypothetical protein
MIPLAGAATKGGKLLCGFTWSIDAGDGIDDKCVFMTDQGERADLHRLGTRRPRPTGRQEGRYATSTPLGMNCHTPIGGDVLIATVDGIIPISASITKDTRNSSWLRSPAPSSRCGARKWMRNAHCLGPVEVGRARLPACDMARGGLPGAYTMGAVNIATGAWARFTGWDAMCFGRLRA